MPPLLVGIDGTASGLEALALGSALATLMGSPLLLCAVHGSDRGAFGGGRDRRTRDEAQRWLAQAEERLGDAVPWSAQTVVATSVAHGLVAFAGEAAAAMIVLGSSRHGPLGRLLAGSTVRRVAHGAPCAVAVTPREWRLRSSTTPLTIGAAITDSSEAHSALALGAELSRNTGAPLRVLTAVPFDPPADSPFADTGTSDAAWHAARRDYGLRIALAAVSELATATDADGFMLDGDPVDCLANASCDLDFLVMGSRGYGPLRTALLGSVSSALIDRASCPVIIVPHGTHPAPRFAASITEAVRA